MFIFISINQLENSRDIIYENYNPQPPKTQKTIPWARTQLTANNNHQKTNLFVTPPKSITN